MIIEMNHQSRYIDHFNEDHSPCIIRVVVILLFTINRMAECRNEKKKGIEGSVWAWSDCLPVCMPLYKQNPYPLRYIHNIRIALH